MALDSVVYALLRTGPDCGWKYAMQLPTRETQAASVDGSALITTAVSSRTIGTSTPVDP